MKDPVIHEVTFEAEDSLIGAILIEATDGTRNAINEVAKLLKPSDFLRDYNNIIFAGMIACDKPPHLINTSRQLVRQGTMTHLILSHMAHCVSRVPCSLDYMDYTRCVRDYSDKRHGVVHPQVKGAQ